MPDPIRVTRAVRRCLCWCHRETTPGEGVCHCNDGWVDVPVDEECPTRRTATADGWTCPDCDGTGRRLRNWATGWYWGDEVLIRGDVGTLNHRWSDGRWWVGRPHRGEWADPADLTLVLSDPSHRPEPMRWKQ